MARYRRPAREGRWFPDAALFRRSARPVSEHFRIHKGGGHSIEGRAVLARYDAADELLTAWDSTQMPHKTKRVLVEALGLSEEQVRVVAPETLDPQRCLGRSGISPARLSGFCGAAGAAIRRRRRIRFALALGRTRGHGSSRTRSCPCSSGDEVGSNE